MTAATKNEKILVIGALGQIGQELTEALRIRYGQNQVIASDIREEVPSDTEPYIMLDVLNKTALYEVIQEHGITTIYNLAAILSAKGEQNPEKAWEINMGCLFSTLEALRETDANKLFWPSSIAVFGPHSPMQATPQYTQMDPNTVYGISKLAGERWCEYYVRRYGVDVRSLRYPGLIGYKAVPGGGTTDYAVDIFHHAVQHGNYHCYLGPDTVLPMMYMPDAIRATLELMNADDQQIRIRSSYNLAGISFSPQQICEAIQKHLPHFICSFQPDFRQQIADSWPESIDDLAARNDWQWKAEYDLDAMVADMLIHISARYPLEVKP